MSNVEILMPETGEVITETATALEALAAYVVHEASGGDGGWTETNNPSTNKPVGDVDSK